MDPATILISALVAAFITLLVVGGAGWVILGHLRRLTGPLPVADMEATPALSGGLTVLQNPSCDSCVRWNLEAGQRAMASQPAFATAATHLQPWQMSRQRQVTFDPAYLELETKMLAAQQAGEYEQAAALQEELLGLDPGETVDDTSDVSPQMMDLDWRRLGLCGRHKELRFATDQCDAWSAT